MCWRLVPRWEQWNWQYAVKFRISFEGRAITISGWVEYGVWEKEKGQGWLHGFDLSSQKDAVTIHSVETCSLFIHVTTSVLGSEAVSLYFYLLIGSLHMIWTKYMMAELLNNYWIIITAHAVFTYWVPAMCLMGGWSYDGNIQNHSFFKDCKILLGINSQWLHQLFLTLNMQMSGTF